MCSQMTLLGAPAGECWSLPRYHRSFGFSGAGHSEEYGRGTGMSTRTVTGEQATELGLSSLYGHHVRWEESEEDVDGGS